MQLHADPQLAADTCISQHVFLFSPIDRRGVCDRATGRAARLSRPDRAGEAGSARARLERDKFEGGLAQVRIQWPLAECADVNILAER